MHDLQALIANSEPLRRHAQSLRTAVLCELPQGLALLPLTDVVLAELAVGQGDVPSALLPTLTRCALAFAVAASQAAPVAFVSTCYFGGQGTQDALVWRPRRIDLFAALGAVCRCLAELADQPRFANPGHRRGRRIGRVRHRRPGQVPHDREMGDVGARVSDSALVGCVLVFFRSVGSIEVLFVPARSH